MPLTFTVWRCSDVWAAIFQHLPDLPHALPRLRLVCKQVRRHGLHTGSAMF